MLGRQVELPVTGNVIAMSPHHAKTPMAAGVCRHCAYQPVAFDATICPKCAGVDPNPSQRAKRRSAYLGLGTALGATLGATLGASTSFLGEAAGAFGAGFVGLFFGCAIGLVVASILLSFTPAEK